MFFSRWKKKEGRYAVVVVDAKGHLGSTTDGGVISEVHARGEVKGDAEPSFRWGPKLNIVWLGQEQKYLIRTCSLA